MLSRDDHRVDLQWLYGSIGLLQILDGDLCLAVWTQPPQLAILAHICQFLAQASSHGVCQWHAILSLVAGIAKHDTLVASTNIQIVLANMNSSSDVRALLVDAHNDLACLIAQALA